MKEHRKPRILNVDDNDAERYAITRILRQAGFQVQEAATGRDALRLAEEGPDLILLDIQLPDISGLEVCRQIKANPRTATIPVVHLSTTFVGADDQVAGMEQGADGYLTHPVDPKVLVATLNAFLRLKRVENALRESEERFRTALKNSPVIVFNQDQELRYTWIYNPQSGFEPETIPGKTDADLFTAEDAAHLTEIKRRILETGVPAREEVSTTVGGQVFFYDLTAEPLRDASGNIVGVTCVLVDITERKRMEEMLREALAQANEGKRILDALMEHVPEGITIADAPDVRIRMVSRYGRELTGKSKEILEGITVDKHVQQWDIYSIDGVTPAKNEDLPLTRATQKGELVKDEEWVLGHQSGKRIPVLCNAGPIRDDAGNIIGGVIAWRDISERKRLEQAVEKARADFLFAVSHELKTPLHVMGTTQEMIELLPEEQRLAQFRQYGDVWRRNLMRLRFIIENLVDSQRPPGMGLKLEQQPADLMDLAQEIAGELEPLATARSVQLRFQGESLPPSSLDSNAVRRLLENLLTNAIKFSHPGGQVEIRLRAQDEMVCLDVCDFGMGIDPQIKPFLFQPFYRSPEALKAGVQGTGLGLYVSKMIAEAHGGMIQLESEPGKGTTVTVRLPLAG